MRKLKVYYASSVHLRWVPDNHRASNGNRQFGILVKASSKRRAAEIIGQSVGSLNHMGFSETRCERDTSVCVKPETVYYFMDNSNHKGSEDFRKWIEYQGKPKSSQSAEPQPEEPQPQPAKANRA